MFPTKCLQRSVLFKCYLEAKVTTFVKTRNIIWINLIVTSENHPDNLSFGTGTF